MSLFATDEGKLAHPGQQKITPIRPPTSRLQEQEDWNLGLCRHCKTVSATGKAAGWLPEQTRTAKDGRFAGIGCRAPQWLVVAGLCA